MIILYKSSLIHFRHLLAILLWNLIFCLSISAQDLLEQGKKNLHNQAWEEARNKFQQVLQVDPQIGEAWFYLGLTYHNLKQPEQALLAYQKADSLKFAPTRTRYNIACAYALLNEKGKSIHALADAINAGFTQLQLLSNDPDLNNIRNEPEFHELYLQLEQKVYPCIHNPKYKEFDFWIGEWEVFNLQGQKVGENHIQKIMRGCLIQENWISIRGSKGTSINYYDPASNLWKQNWVDENGRLIWYQGELKGNAMHFQGEFIDPEGKVEQAQVVLELLPNGNVHHLIKHSKDAGTTWYTWFEGLYVRKKSKKDTLEKP